MRLYPGSPVPCERHGCSQVNCRCCQVIRPLAERIPMFEFEASGRIAENRAIKSKDGSRIVAHALKMSGEGYSFEVALDLPQFDSLQGATHCKIVGTARARYDGAFQMYASKVVRMTELEVARAQLAKAEAAEKAALAAAKSA